MSFGKKNSFTENRSRKCYLEQFPTEVFSEHLKSLLENYKFFYNILKL